MSVETTAEPPLRALNAIIRELDAPTRARADFAAYLRDQGVEGADLDALLKVGPDRMLAYRRMAQSRLRKTIREFIPRTAARIGAEPFRVLVTEWMDERAPRSPYLRDVPAEFVEWACPRWQAHADTPDYYVDLARHELLELDVRNDPRGGEAPTGKPMALDRPLRFDGAARRMTYGHAVHRLPMGEGDRTEPERKPTELLVYRDGAGKVRYLELIPFAAALLDQLLAGEAVQPAIAASCAALREPLDDDKLGQVAVLLADLADRDVMRGAE